jgi:predicted transcriptional regulator
MKAHQLKDLRESLLYGDVSTIAREIGVTEKTVQNSLKGLQRNETAKLIIKHAQTIIKQRTDRVEALKRILEKQREEREKREAERINDNLQYQREAAGLQ